MAALSPLLLRWRKQAGLRLERTFSELDAMHIEEWNNIASDELIAWYRVRNRVMADRNISHEQRQQMLDAINIRVQQVRLANQQWYSVTRTGHVISNHN